MIKISFLVKASLIFLLVTSFVGNTITKRNSRKDFITQLNKELKYFVESHEKINFSLIFSRDSLVESQMNIHVIYENSIHYNGYRGKIKIGNKFIDVYCHDDAKKYLRDLKLVDRRKNNTLDGRLYLSSDEKKYSKPFFKVINNELELFDEDSTIIDTRYISNRYGPLIWEINTLEDLIAEMNLILPVSQNDKKDINLRLSNKYIEFDPIIYEQNICFETDRFNVYLKKEELKKSQLEIGKGLSECTMPDYEFRTFEVYPLMYLVFKKRDYNLYELDGGVPYTYLKERYGVDWW
ncbi:MAG: hypothetical protein C4K58_01210 [Flavobacteriaceae bacterium]|nr:MAG: hypothetical protein C4K58_01210 [Flavobacteriaceae bacterium]